MTPAQTAHLIPVESLENPYHNLPCADKVRVYTLISKEDMMELRSYFPRKGVIDSVLGHLLRGFLLHINSLGLQSRAKDFHKNEQILLSLLKQYVPGTNDSRIKFTLDETRSPEPELIPPGIVQ